MKTKAIIFLLLFSLLTTTCKKEANPSIASQSGSKIMVTGQDASAGLKSTMSGLNVSWVATSDKIGLYCAQATSNGTNAAYTASTTGSTSAFTGSMTWGSSTHYFYAYYPWVTGSAASTVVPISLSATQTQTGTNNNHIGDLDFTVASATAAPGTSGQPVDVNLSFRHVFTLLEFDLQLASGSNTDLSSIELYSTDSNLSLTSGTINLGQSTPSGDNSYTLISPVGTNKVTLNTSGCTLSTGAAISAYMMILSGDQVGSTSSDMTIKVTSAAGVTVVVKNGMNFVRGKRYTIDLTGLTFAAITPADGDGNTYNTVTIGSQVWMAANLKTAKYLNGDNIGTTNVAAELGSKYQWPCYGSESNVAVYGRLYTWYAATDSRGVCPTNWHVPTATELTTLSNYLGGLNVAGGKLKVTGTTNWVAPNNNSTNESGLTALAGGYISNNVYSPDRYYANWWGSTLNSLAQISTDDGVLSMCGCWQPEVGASVRCVKDPPPG